MYVHVLYTSSRLHAGQVNTQYNLILLWSHWLPHLPVLYNTKLLPRGTGTSMPSAPPPPPSFLPLPAFPATPCNLPASLAGYSRQMDR